MKISSQNKILLIAIIFVATFLRFNRLSSIPPSASLDEASIGYNAYSILKTGADEYGTKFPILLRAYDDFRPALYAYLVIPFLKLFDLTILAVRLPSVILSVLTVASTYFLVKGLFRLHELTQIGKRINTDILALLSSFLLAISPWHIYISRLGHETNVGLAFVVFAITFFIYRRFILSSIFFALSFYTYQSEKIFVPLIVLILIIIFRKEIFEKRRKALISVVLGIILSLPILIASFSPNAWLRFAGTSVFINNPSYQESAEKLLQYKKKGNIIGQLLANRRVTTVKIFLTNYFSHYSFNFLFRNSDNESFRAPRVGLLYHWEFPFLLLGLIFLFLKLRSKKIRTLIVLWLIISFIPSALTTGAPHAMRSYNLLPTPQILTALGTIGVFNYLRSRLRWFFYFIFLFIATSLIYYLVFFYKQYFFVFPKAQSFSFQYALAKTIPFILDKEKTYDKIVFSNKDNLHQSYMFLLFYSKYDPFLYQREGGTISGGFDKTHKIGKYEFRPLVWERDKEKKALYVGNPFEIPKDISPIFSGAYLDGLIGTKVIEILK